MTGKHTRTPTACLLVGCLLLAIGCGDDDGPTRPGGDTTAPVVVGIVPAHHASGVAVDAIVTITFDEDMDPASHTGQVTLSSGTIAAMTWTTARVLTVTHDGWPQGAGVTVTVGTGLRDVAGNQLAAPFTATFYTTSPDLVFLASNPDDGAADVNRNAMIELLFSAPMNLTSVAANLTLRDAAQNDLAFDVRAGTGAWLVVDPDEAMPAQTVITVTVGADAQDLGGRSLGTPATVTFTTGSDVDTTPPTILSFTPASGTTIPTGTAALVITFSEPIDPSSFQPTEVGAELFWLAMTAGTEPVWSQNNTVFTIALPTPLPAGLPLWVTFAGYADVNGVVQDTPSTWSATVAGTADYYPLVDERQSVFLASWERGTIGNDIPEESGSYVNHIKFEAQGGGVFHRVEYDDSYTQAWSWEIMDRTATALRLHGFHDEGDDEDDPETTMFSTPVDYLRLPPAAAATWTAETGVQGQPGVLLEAAGVYVERLDRLEATSSKDVLQAYWTNVWVATLTYTMSVDDVVQMVGTETMYLAPGFGLVRSETVESNPIDDRWERNERVLMLDAMR